MKYFIIYGRCENVGSFDFAVQTEIFPTRRDAIKNIRDELVMLAGVDIPENAIVFTGIQELTEERYIEWTK